MSAPLEHYRRKRFFYRFFMRRSPRGGAMFGLAWMLMAITMFPLLLQAVPSFVHLSLLACIAVAGVVFPLFLVYGMHVYVCGVEGILRRSVRRKGLRFLLAAGAAFVPLSGCLILPGLIRRKRFAAIVSAVLGSAAYMFWIVAGMLHYMTGALLPIVGTLFLLAALAGTEDRHKFSWKFLIPLLIALIVPPAYDLKLQRDVAAERDAIARELGHSIELDAFLAREARGFSVEQEPLKSLIAAAPELPDAIRGGYETAEAGKEAREWFRWNHADFVDALERFSALPVNHVAHRIPEKEPLAGVKLSELTAFRLSAVYLAAVICAEPENKKQVCAANRASIRLREWATHHSWILSHLTGIAIEAIRLDALRHALESGQYTRAEFAELVGAPVDWDRSMRVALGNKAAAIQSIVEYLKDTDGKKYSSRLKMGRWGQMQGFPFHLKSMLLRDTRFALRSLRQGCAVPPPGLSAEEKMKRFSVDVEEIRRNGYILSGMILPSLPALNKKNAQIADRRTMALIAADVAEYFRRGRKVPGSLDFLSKVPVSEWDGRPFRLENTSDGFKIIRDGVKGSEDVPDKPPLIYPVRLEDR